MMDRYLPTIEHVLDRPIAYHRSFVRFGGVTVAVMLSQAMYWSNRTQDQEGWFFKTQEEWEEETGLTRREQESARDKLKRAGVLEEQRRGAPARMYYRVHLDRLLDILTSSDQQDDQADDMSAAPAPAGQRFSLENQQFGGKRHSSLSAKKSNEIISLAESAKLDWRKAPNKIGGKRQTRLAESAKLDWRKAPNSIYTLITETTSETTAETTAERARCVPAAHGSLDASLPAPAVQALSEGSSPLQGKTNDGTQAGPAGGRPPEGSGVAVASAQATLVGMDWDASGQGVGDPVLLQAIQAHQKQKGTRLPAGFVVPDIWITYAKRARGDLSEAQIRDAAHNFAAYWSTKPGKEGLKLNWLTTWLNWVRKERAHADGQWRKEREPRPGEIIPPKPPEYYSSLEHDRRLLEMMEKYPGMRVSGVTKEQLRARLMKAQEEQNRHRSADQ